MAVQELHDLVGSRRRTGMSAYGRTMQTARLRPSPAFPAPITRVLPSRDDNRLRDGEHDPASELDCLRPVFARTLLQAAEARSRHVGIGADQVLIRSGVIDEDAYLRALSAHTGLAIEPLTAMSRNDCCLPDHHLPRVAQHGLLPVRTDGELVWIVAPRGLAVHLEHAQPERLRRENPVEPRAIGEERFLRVQLVVEPADGLEVAGSRLAKHEPILRSAASRRGGGG